jgi:hypothetical protein
VTVALHGGLSHASFDEIAAASTVVALGILGFWKVRGEKTGEGMTPDGRPTLA